MAHLYPVRCRHFSCQCTQAEELVYMAERLHRLDFLVLAMNVHKDNLEVRCRHIPRLDHHGHGNDIPLPPLPEDKAA